METFLAAAPTSIRSMASAIGHECGDVDVAVFASHAAENGYLRHSDYNTQTVNLNFRFKLGDKDNFYVKAVTNALNANVPTG
ncbi:MAG: hypothetical protein MRJ92_02800 [Nitrospira sp.]|nr:hypothetical protein [Nitrospira sp.]